MEEEDRSREFERIYAEYSARVLNLVYRLVGNEETARDLVQEIFIKVYENLPSFRRQSELYTWIYRISLNHVTNHIKRERRRRWLDIMDTEVSRILHGKAGGERTPAAPEEPADRRLEARERAIVVWREVQKLPPKYRVPLVLHHYEEMSYQEIASVLGLSLSAVESRIHRAKKKLIARLKPWLDKV